MESQARAPASGCRRRGRKPRPRVVGVEGDNPLLDGGDDRTGVEGDDSDNDGGGRSHRASGWWGLTGGGTGVEQMAPLRLVLEKSDALEEIAVVIREPDKVLSLRV